MNDSLYQYYHFSSPEIIYYAAGPKVKKIGKLEGEDLMQLPVYKLLTFDIHMAGDTSNQIPSSPRVIIIIFNIIIVVLLYCLIEVLLTRP